jgi:hypothetical protein
LLQRKRASKPNTHTTFQTHESLPDLSTHSQYPTWNPNITEASPSSPYAAHPSLPTPSQPRSWNQTRDENSPSYNYEASPHYHSPSLLSNQDGSLPPLSGTDESFASFIPLTPRSQTPPPFQFASSSLSTALSDPHVSKPLPPIHLNSPRSQYPTAQDLDSLPDHLSPYNASSSSHDLNNQVYDDDDVQMSENMLFDHEQHPTISDVRTRPEGFTGHSGDTNSGVVQESPNIHHVTTEASHMRSSTAQTSCSPHYPSPHHFLPSASTTPTVSPLSLSPPNPSTTIDLPYASLISNSSVLFSSHYPSGSKKRKTSTRRRDASSGPLRLDSALPATTE